MRLPGPLYSPQQASWLQLAKTAIAVTAAWFVSVLLLGEQLPIFAAIAALLVVAPSVNQSLGKGIERSVGVLGGVVLAWLAGFVETRLGLAGNTLVVLAVVLLAIVLARLLRLAPTASYQVPISAMIMLALGAGAGPEYGLLRIVETLIGAVCALVVNFAIVAPVHHEPAEQALRRLGHAVADAFDDVAAALSPGSSHAGLLDRTRRLRNHIKSTRAAMDALEDSLRFNPRGRRLRERIGRDERLLLVLTVLTNRVIGMARSIEDRTGEVIDDDPILQGIRRDCRRIASEVRGVVDSHAHDDGRTATLPTFDVDGFTSPIHIPDARPRDWVLVGALLEDVRQARESLEARDEE